MGRLPTFIAAKLAVATRRHEHPTTNVTNFFIVLNTAAFTGSAVGHPPFADQAAGAIKLRVAPTSAERFALIGNGCRKLRATFRIAAHLPHCSFGKFDHCNPPIKKPAKSGPCRSEIGTAEWSEAF